MAETQSAALASQSTNDHPSYDDVNTPVILLVGFISAVVTFLIIALVQGMCYHWEQSYLNSLGPTSLPSATEVAAQKQVLEGGDGILPIEDAMTRVVDQYGQ